MKLSDDIKELISAVLWFIIVLAFVGSMVYLIIDFASKVIK